MKDHLSDAQLEELVAGSGEEAAREHLASCAACHAEEERLRGALAGFGAAVRAAGERPEAFWARQRAAIAGRPEARPARARPLAWASATALLVLAALLLLREPPPEPAIAQVDPDHALLVEVQRSVRREVPQALAPAALLAEEMTRAAEKKANR